MPSRTSPTGSELFIVDNSDADWKVRRYLADCCELSGGIGVSRGSFGIGIGANLGTEDVNTFFHDLHPDLKADYALANLPANMRDGLWSGESYPPQGEVDENGLVRNQY